jgi:hypothetical protein
MLDAEWDFISAALPRLLTGDNDHLQTNLRQLLNFSNFTGRWDEWLWLSEQAEARALLLMIKRTQAGEHITQDNLCHPQPSLQKCWRAPPAPPNTGK